MKSCPNPQKRFARLPIERIVGIDAGMEKIAAVIEAETERLQPRDVLARQVARIADAVARQRGIPPLLSQDQGSPSPARSAKIFMIAEETHNFLRRTKLKFTNGSTTPRCRAAVDVVANQDETGGRPACIFLAPGEDIGEGAMAAVDIADSEGQAPVSNHPPALLTFDTISAQRTRWPRRENRALPEFRS